MSLPINLEGKVKILDMLVVPELSHSLILGIDFWTMMGIVPGLHRGCWSFQGNDNYLPVISAIVAKEFLTPEQNVRLDALTTKYFDQMGNRLGCTALVAHEIITNAQPIRQRAYRVSPAIQAKIDEEVQKMLQDDVIEPSASSWSSPVLMIPKRDGSYRFCVDYRLLNKATERDATPFLISRPY